MTALCLSSQPLGASHIWLLLGMGPLVVFLLFPSATYNLALHTSIRRWAEEIKCAEMKTRSFVYLLLRLDREEIEYSLKRPFIKLFPRPWLMYLNKHTSKASDSSTCYSTFHRERIQCFKRITPAMMVTTVTRVTGVTTVTRMTMMKDTNNRYLVQKSCVSQHTIRN